MLDGFIDAMQDTSGVDASASTNELRDSTGEYYSGSQPGNYYGSEADGALTTSGNVTLATAGSGDDRDMVVKNYSSLNIQSGHTMTVDNKCRGLFIYVSGNCTIAGTLHMNEKGAYDADPTQAGGSDNAAVNAAVPLDANAVCLIDRNFA